MFPRYTFHWKRDQKIKSKSKKQSIKQAETENKLLRAIQVSNKVDFTVKLVKRDKKERYCILRMRKTHQENKLIMNKYLSNVRSPNFM